ncbi:hypothetical protein [Polaromonas naphthalenivorans]|uniref:Uncharacterized protein n=1 Tax=Polaromonas naphthalenivorans (strain CJ2) TaxID=365044 RepID=A1VW55_POLNA|nr:hypothetical protein [Polaromonas naphthalenivorans]ABM39883.1 hypothetical protein Pnap_4818 [Polaromonas naphthalenivorans CJ2]
MKSIQNTTPTGLPRDEYGALYTSQVLSQEQQLQLKDLLGKAVATGIVPEPFITSNKKEIDCLNLDIFDVLVFRGKVKGLVVQARSFWKNIRKGYTRIQKSYFLVMRSGKKLDIKELENSTCVKRAKNTAALGQLVNHYLGKTTVACKSGAKVAAWTGYKVLARDQKGSLVSAFDGSAYVPGIWREETATAGHRGGFYYYGDKEIAVTTTRSGATFAKSVSEGKSLVLCKVECAGKQVGYTGGKWAVSRLRVIEELEAVTLDVGT